MFGFFFSIIAVFQILKPLKKGLFVSHFGAEQELIAKGINIDVAFTAMIGFTYLYNWLGGRRLVRFCVDSFPSRCWFSTQWSRMLRQGL